MALFSGLFATRVLFCHVHGGVGSFHVVPDTDRIVRDPVIQTIGDAERSLLLDLIDVSAYLVIGHVLVNDNKFVPAIARGKDPGIL